MTRADRSRAAGLAAVLAASGVPATAQGYAAAPFHEAPVAAAQAMALELVALRAEAAAAVSEPSEDLAEETGRMREEDLSLVLASLARADAGAAEALSRAVDAFLDVLEAGEPLAEPAAAVRAAADRAAAALGHEPTPALRGAVASLLLVSEVGLAEAYEEGAEGELEGYPVGWAALQRVKAIAAELRPEMSESAAADADDAVDRLDALFPTADPPERFASDPEEAESLAHRLVALIEEGADADLYFGRDLPRALDTVRGLAAAGCADPDPSIGAETIAIAAFFHEDALANPLGVLAPDAQAAAAAAFDAHRSDPQQRPAACDGLLDALDRAAGALAPPGSP